jgi:Domain of unknown function (DUF4920)
MLRNFAVLLLMVSPLVLAHDHADKSADKAPRGPSAVVDGKQVYGEALPDTANVVSIGTAVKNFKEGNGPQVISGEITKICQKEGCWMILAEGEQFARVMTKHKFFFEDGLRGKAVVYGTLEKKQMSLEQTQHMAEDAGKDPKSVTEADAEYRLVATSVVVEPS